MRMRIGTRIIFSLLLLFIMAVCVLVMLAAFDVISAKDVTALANGFTQTSYKYIWAAVAAVIIIVALPLLFFGIKKDEPTAVTLLAATDGRVDITVDAIKELTETYLNEVPDAVVQRILVVPVSYRTLKLRVYLSVRQGVEIPVLTSKISEELRAHIEKYAGLIADHVAIRVLPMRKLQYPAK